MNRPDERFVLVKGGKVHRFPAFEQCNIDAADVVADISGHMAARIAEEEPGQMCEHCFPRKEPA